MVFRCIGYAVLVILSIMPWGDSAVAAERRTPVVTAVEKAGPAVVNIRTEKVVRRSGSPFFGFSDPFFDQFFRDLAPPRAYKTQSLGTGVIIDAQGLVLTNAHVIEKASKIFVALTTGGRELEAELVGKDHQLDLAVLRILGAGPFPELKPARSDDLLVGETVIAIGNPLGLGHSITTGVVSSTRRRMSTENNEFGLFIQTDALINPGNSGGPLINIKGELIGINTAIIQQAQGIGFSIPIDTAKRVLDDLIEFGRVRPTFTGILPGEVGEAFSGGHGTGGVLVHGVEPGSPAEKAGLRIADVVLTVDGDRVGATDEYRSLLRTYTPGDSVRLGVLRSVEPLELTLALVAIPEGYAVDYAERVFGLRLADSRQGLRVQSVLAGSKAEQLGIRSGDFVVEVAGARLSSVDEFSRLMEHLYGRQPLRFLVVRGGRGYYVDL
ncbi:trypsin-like peptidase domain-containing protein [Trichloromonas sp.]|uniref:trypsin-like peptidase domain-containing protein n=1 Tax=Trichloromonas sp. TaxID=3069249 RepID=UPI002A3D99C5|nr:trypsin-like peptidase domain-containing protein [Trichloromonas sp.]